MLEMLNIGIDNALAFQMSGKIIESDMQIVLSNAKGKIERHGSIVIFEKIDSFDGAELAAILAEFKYLVDVGMSNVTKVAILTDKQWIAHIANIEDKIFSGIDMKCFPIEEQPAAIAFLKSG
jgi:hypothetical protein